MSKCYRIRIIFIAAGLSLIGAGFTRDIMATDKAPHLIEEGTSIEWFAGWSAEGQVINRTSILKGDQEHTLMIFAASWCTVCKSCLATLKSNAKALQGKKIKSFAIDFMEEEAEGVPYFESYGFSKDAIILDKFGQILQSVGKVKEADMKSSAALPFTIVFDKKGVVRRTISGCGHDYLGKITNLD